MDQIKESFGVTQDLKKRFEKEKKNIQDMFIKWFQVFKKGL